MTRDVKSLAAEIEAVLRKHRLGKSRVVFGESGQPTDRVAVAAAEIAANQSRAFEDGARWMRQEAARVCWVQAAKDDLHALGLEAGGAIATACVVRNEAALHRARGNEIAALPLKPEGERSDA